MIDSVCSITEILEEQITIVASINAKPQPFPDKEVIYFITPSVESVQILLDHFSSKPLYAAAHVYFTSTLSDRLFDKITRSPGKPYIKTLKEMNLDFFVLESNLFSLEAINSVFTCYQEVEASSKYELQYIAKRLSFALATLGEYPYIRYYNDPNDKSPTGQNPLIVARMLQTELDEIVRNDTNFLSDPSYTPATVIILDRSVDMVAPLLHDFTYQSMVNDLLDLDIDKYSLEIDGKQTVIRLDDEDSFWVKQRHKHISETIQEVSKAVQNLTTDNKAAQWAQSGPKNGDQLGNINDLKDTLMDLPKYQALKALYSAHTKICQDLMEVYTNTNLEEIAVLEQEMSTGETSAGKRPKNIFGSLVNLVTSPGILPDNKLRLIMLYIISQNGISEKERTQLMDVSRLSLEENQAITNMSMMGVRLSSSFSSSQNSQNPFKNRSIKSDPTTKFENSRYIPAVKTIINDQLKNNIDDQYLSWLRPPPDDAVLLPVRNSGISTGERTATIRSTKSSWATKKTSSPIDGRKTTESQIPKYSHPRVILFMLGGITHSEIRSCYEIMDENSREIMIGSTHILDPTLFLNTLKVLHKGPPISRVKGKLTALSSSMDGLALRSQSRKDGQSSRGNTPSQIRNGSSSANDAPNVRSAASLGRGFNTARPASKGVNDDAGSGNARYDRDQASSRTYDKEKKSSSRSLSGIGGVPPRKASQGRGQLSADYSKDDETPARGASVNRTEKKKGWGDFFSSITKQ